jgi:Ca-activated chloride channel family protein
MAATEANIEKAVQVIDELQGSGSTELLPALKRALALPRAEGMSRSVVIVTDGYVTVEAEAFDLIRTRLGEANMFAFGIGSGVNRHLIEGMARVGMGEPFVITDPSGAPARAEKFRKYIQSPVLTQVKAEFKGLSVYDVEPLSIPDVLAERPIIVFGKWRGRPTGKVTVRGRTGRGKYEKSLNVAEFRPRSSNAGLRYLWARHRIQMLDDYNNLAPDDDRVKEVTQLGLDYNLLTQYTSFVAIDSRVRSDGKPTTVKQPLPLPQGVSDYAVGGYASAGSGALRGMSMAKCRAPLSQAQTAVDACEEIDGDGLYYSADPEPPSAPEAVAEVTGVEVSCGSITTGSGPLVKVIKGLVDAEFEEIENCYASELAADPGLSGEVLVKVVVLPDGSVDRVLAIRNELNTAVLSCIKRVLKGIAFANSTGGEMEVFLTFSFSP